MPIDLERFRAEIPGVVNRVHLNNAGAGLMPLPVLQAMTDSVDTAAVEPGDERG